MELILAWQNRVTRRWIPVARIGRDDDGYWLRYTEGVADSQARSQALLAGLEDVDIEYRSNDIFPFLRNRIYNKRRGDVRRYLDWIGLDSELSDDPLAELAASGGPRATDSYELHPVPEPVAGQYLVSFFVHGPRYTGVVHGTEVEPQTGSRLYLQLDIQNEADPEAISLRFDDPKVLLGYLPRMLGGDIHRLLASNGQDGVRAYLAARNDDAPLRMRYRCRIECAWPEGFRPFDAPEFRPLARVRSAAVVA